MSNPESHNLWLFLELLTRRRRFIFTTVIVITLVATVVAFALPKWYEATSLLLPPKDVSMPIAGTSELAEVVSVVKGLNLPVMVTPSDLFVNVVRRR